MKQRSYDEAVSILAGNVKPAGVKTVGIDKLCGRILAGDIIADENVPPFARSPYDGYAFKSLDTVSIGAECDTVTLHVIENIRAGQVATMPVTGMTAIRLMTGSPIPDGADCVCKYEDTDYTDDKVVIKKACKSGENIIAAGEDIRKGSVVAHAGSVIDPGMIGVLASLGINRAAVYKRIKAAVITTGDELADTDDELLPGMIRDSNRYTISAALAHYGCKVSYIGHAADDKKSIADLIDKGLAGCDVLVSTGGVSVGDYDLVPKVMADMGFDVLAERVAIKPGMACVYGIKDGRIMLALSGNPASALTNLQCVCAPALRKMAGYSHYEHDLIDLTLDEGFTNKSGNLRLIRGRMVIRDGRACLVYPKRQGNVVISSAAGADAYALVGPQTTVSEGECVKGFLI